MTTEDVTIVEAPLSADERRDLERHEGTIRRGQQTFIEVGLALADVQQRRLYRESHASFETYLQAHFPDISRRRAYQLIDGAATAQQLTDVYHGTQPGEPPPITSERQVRPLAGLEPAQQRAAFAQAAAAAGGKPPTAAQVEAAARAVKGGGRPAPDPAPAPLAPAPPAAGEVILELPAEPADAPPADPPAPAIPVAAALEAGLLRQAEALVALLQQALSLAESERDRLQRQLPGVRVVVPDDAVEQAARSFLASPGLRGAAGFLAMSAQQEGS
jgi:hypothetical protein